MSTTIEPRRQRPAGLAIALTLAPAIGLGCVAGVAALAAPGGDYWAIGPRAALFGSLAGADAGFVREAPFGLVARSDGPASVRALYRGGAWLVLPVRAGGCAALARAVRAI
jgi:hypothetical protein